MAPLRDIRRVDGALCWSGGMAIDADGSPHAYHPDNASGLDSLPNAGRPGCWWGIACDESGTPYIQGADDPAPGYYVSVTALENNQFAKSNPRRYVDSETVPYVVVPPELLAMGVRPGDLAYVRCGALASPAIVADVGPKAHLGEGSIALARALRIPESPKRGGIGSGVDWVVWPKSKAIPRWPRDLADAAKMYAKWSKGSEHGV